MGLLKKFCNVYDHYILDIVKKEFPVQRNRKYDDAHFLKYFKLVLSKLTSWSALQFVSGYPSDSPNHYKYVSNIFRLWSSRDIFKRAYNSLLQDNYFKLKTILKSNYVNLYIDCTYIINKYGIDKSYFNPQYHKKNVSKLSIVCDDNKIMLSCVPMDIKNVTFKHDITCVQETLNDIPINVSDAQFENLIGDGGYNTQEKFKLGNKYIRIVAPKKKSQHVKNTTNEKKLLCNRYKIESVNASLKNYFRVLIRKDKYMCNYMGFLYLASQDILSNNLIKIFN